MERVGIAREDLPGLEDRHHRQSLVAWWDQDRVRRGRFLVVGAGALGSEALESLALMGAGFVLVYDMDSIERSNLSRGPLFREGDVGRPKAEVAAGAMREIDPGVRAHARVENAVHRAGLGVFHWADVVLGCVDNREARIFINSACARTGRVWVDGAIEGFAGVVRTFDPARGACYECTMNSTDRALVAQRRSCAMLARDAAALGRVPATAVAASIIGAWQAQEALKHVHGQPTLVGEGIHVDGLWNEVSRVRYPRREECGGHDAGPALVRTGLRADRTSVGALLDRAERELGQDVSIDFSRDVVLELTCPECGDAERGGAAVGEVDERRARCRRCGTHRVVEFAASACRGSRVPEDATLAEIGLPAFDVVVARRGVDAAVSWVLDGDAADVLGACAPSWEA